MAKRKVMILCTLNFLKKYSMDDKILKRSAIVALLMLIAILFFKNCSGKKVQKKGKFEASKPLNEKIKIIHHYDTLKKVYVKEVNFNNKELNLLKNEVIKLSNQNDSLKMAFKNASSEKKDSIYNEAISLNEFSKEFKNEDLFIKASGIARGTVEFITLDYELKQKKPPRFKLLAGLGFGAAQNLENTAFKASLGFQNSKDNIYRISYNKLGNENYYLVEFDYVFFKK